LWTPESGNYDVTKGTYVNIQRLNQVRKFLIATDGQRDDKTFLHNNVDFLEWNDNDLAFRKGPVLVFLTNVSGKVMLRMWSKKETANPLWYPQRGSPSVQASIGVSSTGWKGSVVK
jgi:hypothetical protein